MTITATTHEFPRPPRVALVEPADPAELRGTPILLAAFGSGLEFLQHSDPHAGPAGEVAVATRAAPPAGADVVLEVYWAGLPNRVYVRAHAAGHARGRLIARVHPDERPKLAFLEQAARGALLRIHARRHQRFCVRLPLQWRPFGAAALVPGVAEDLSIGGVMIASAPAAVQLGDAVVVRIRAEAAAADLVLTGSVRHLHERDGGELALGVKFRYRGGGEPRELRRMLRAFAAKGVVLVDPCL